MLRLNPNFNLLRDTLLLAALAAGAANAQNKTAAQLQAMFQARSHTSAQITMVYRLYVPTGYDPARKYPLVVTLHGVGERGNNNVNQLTLEELAQPWVRDSVQAKHPHFVMIPQCPATNNQYWWPWPNWPGSWNGTWSGTRSAANAGVVEILDSLKREFSLDTTRFYVGGLSMGGFGAFELMKWNPALFAAAFPAAGAGDTSNTALFAYTQTPFWAFHGAADAVINAERGSRTIVRKVGPFLAKPFVRFVSAAGQANPTAISVDSLRQAVYEDKAAYLYSEITGGNHNSGWQEAWRHPMLTDWVFSRRKVDGVATTSLAGAAPARRARADVRVVLRDGRVTLEKTTPGRNAVAYTLEGKRIDASPALR